MTLASPTFLSLCFAAIVLGRLFGELTARELALAFVNILALTVALTSWHAALVLGLLSLFVYGLGQIVMRAPQARGAAVTGTAIFALWATLFLLKDPGLLPAVNPFAGFPVAILGISYVTFRCISYLMEIVALPNANPIRFFNYIMFFPTLTAGPIDRWRNFSTTMREPVFDEVLPSLHRIANGFIKKFVLADNLASFGVPEVSRLNAGGEASTELLWLAGAFQLFLIYLDFSGYCDIVIGASRLMGIKVIENFNYPFKSRNIQEFWERWHISLSSLIRDYVFTPVTKQIFTKTRRIAQFPLVVTSYFFVMILIALWHGTSIGFLLFGIAQGAALAFYQLWRTYKTVLFGKSTDRSPVNRWIAVAATYLFVSLTLILWMSVDNSWSAYLRGMMGMS